MSYTSIIGAYNFKNLPEESISADGQGIFKIGFSILLTQSDVQQIDYGTNLNYYTTGNSAYVNNFTELSSPVVHALSVVLKSTGTPSYHYSSYFSDVSNLIFESKDNGAIAIGASKHNNVTSSLFQDTETGAVTVGYEPGTSIGKYGDIWLNADAQFSWDNVTNGTEALTVLIHELAHSLGLKHPSAGPENNQRYTIMSYNQAPGLNGYVSGLQLYDIAAIQSIYGYNYTARKENTVYGVGKGFGATASDAFVYSIWDGAGIDLIDASGYTVASRIDLRHGHFSSIGYQANSITQAMVDNVSVAYYAVIENAKGTNTANEIIGNAWNNIIYGAGGNDLIFGDSKTAADYSLTDSILDDEFSVAGKDAPVNSGVPSGSNHSRPGPAAATDINNNITGGNDVLLGGAGNDIIFGGGGNDILHGGYIKSQVDSAAQALSGLRVPFIWDGAGQFTVGVQNIADIISNDGDDELHGGDGNDWLFAGDGINILHGDAGNDFLVGGIGDDGLIGGVGNDSVFGSIGNDFINGGDSHDVLDYRTLNGNVVVRYSSATSATVEKYTGSVDTVSEVEEIIGTNFQDTFIGSVTRPL